MNVACRSVVLTIGLSIGLLLFIGAAQADDTAWKAAHDTDPHLALTAQQLKVRAEKRAAEQTARAVVPASFDTGMSVCASCTGGGSFPSSASLAANQTSQATSYWCGPAAVHEALDAVGVSLSQVSAAAALHTTSAGTAWSGGGTSLSGYPVPDVMNTYQSRNFYIPQPFASATSSATNTYESDLQSDIAALRVPLIGDAWETPTGYHLIGHPSDRQIFHGSKSAGIRPRAHRRRTKIPCMEQARSVGREMFRRIRRCRVPRSSRSSPGAVTCGRRMRRIGVVFAATVVLAPASAAAPSRSLHWCKARPSAAWHRVLERHVVPLSRTISLVPWNLAHDGRTFFATVDSPGFSGVARVDATRRRMTRIKAFPDPAEYQADGAFDGRWLVWSEYHGFDTFNDFTVWAWDSHTGAVRQIGSAVKSPGGSFWDSPWRHRMRAAASQPGRKAAAPTTAPPCTSMTFGQDETGSFTKDTHKGRSCSPEASLRGPSP